jgi:hypothetical protein
MAAATVRSRAVVLTYGEDGTCPGVHRTLAYHHTMPMLRGKGASPREAASGLLRHLSAEADSVVDAWHRADLERVDADVRSLLGELGKARRVASPRTRRPGRQSGRHRAG